MQPRNPLLSADRWNPPWCTAADMLSLLNERARAKHVVSCHTWPTILWKTSGTGYCCFFVTQRHKYVERFLLKSSPVVSDWHGRLHRRYSKSLCASACLLLLLLLVLFFLFHVNKCLFVHTFSGMTCFERIRLDYTSELSVWCEQATKIYSWMHIHIL